MKRIFKTLIKIGGLIILAVLFVPTTGCSISHIINPFDMSPTPTQTINATSPTPTSTPSPTPDPNLISADSDASSVTLKWAGPKGNYRVEYYIKGDEKNTTCIDVEDTEITVSGLEHSTPYYFKVDSISKGGRVTTWLEKVVVDTKAEGPGDPFKNAYTEIKVALNSKFVAYTSPDGCLGADAWAQHDCYLYSNPELNTGAKAIKGGTAFKVSIENDRYCYLRANRRWSLHVRAVNASLGDIEGWMDADLLFIDVADLFRPEQLMYGIHLARTNATSSVFTIGGSSVAVDSRSPQYTRFSVLQSRNSIFADTGYNVIDGITGEALPNYGSPNQMPVIWCLALELKTCQRNALARGVALLIYEGYRPNSTSKAVSDAVSSGDYLTRVQNGMTLANGFLRTNYTYAHFIAYNSTHNKGVAVDLTLMEFTAVDKIGSELPMQTKIHTLDFRGSMEYNNQNAWMLKDIMCTDTHLEPLRSKAEWWHFQLINNTTIFPQLNTYIFADYIM